MPTHHLSRRRFSQIDQCGARKISARNGSPSFGHVNIQAIKKSLQKKTYAQMNHDGVDWTNISNFQCEDCMSGKSCKHNHIVGSRTKYQKKYGPFQYIHSDIFGPVNCPGIKELFFITFTDENTRFRWVYFLEDHTGPTVLPIIEQLINSIKRQFNSTVLAFQFDHGSKYYSNHIR